MYHLKCTSNLHSLLSDCPSLNISDAIERDCLSVLHKLHDQVNGLQLVQVVVQPLAKLFNPANLAALAANSPHSSSNISGNKLSSPSTQQNVSNPQSNASTPSSIHPPPIVHLGGDTDGHHHSRSHSFASSFSVGQNNNNNSLLSTTSTYMMSPDTAQALIARLDTDRDVNWLMEIIGYGLSMPFSVTGEQDSVKDCCTIYCEWLASALLPYNENNEDSKYQQLSKLVPVPIRKEPNRYARKMLSHLYNVFLPRQPLGSTTSATSNKEQSEAILNAVSRQAVLCHRVLRTIESIAQNQSNLMDNETWHHLLALLLTVNDKLLSAPTETDDIGTQLQDRISGVLFELMVLWSSRTIPDASLWKTFHEMSMNWRHRPALIDHWRRVTLLLTRRLVSMSTNMRGGGENEVTFQDLDSSNPSITTSNLSAISTMTYENLSQTWYRFLNLIGNPVELADPSVISRTDEFYHAACLANNVLDPRQHPCLNILPQIFLNSMLGLRDFTESFLGVQQSQTSNPTASVTSNNLSSRRASQQYSQQLLQQYIPQFKLNPDRPKCNAILHIFGDWLFSAALIGSDLSQELYPETTIDIEVDTSGSTASVTSSSTATEIGGSPPSNYSPAFSRRQSHQSTTSSHTSISTNKRRQSKQWSSGHDTVASERMTLDPPLSPDSFESGQAEAMAILCRIFSSKSSAEDICPAYLARFYLCIQHCLAYGSGLDSKLGPNQLGPIKRQLLASVLMNSTTLLQKDLDGINLLIPSFIKAIEFVFECSEKEISVQPPPRQHSRAGSIKFGSNIQSLSNVTNYDLRRACISTLVNLLAYPFHFQDLVIRNCLDGTSPTTSFNSLRPRLLKLLFVALQTETDAINMQILFGGLSLAIHDLAANSSKMHDVPRSLKDSKSSNLDASNRQATNQQQSDDNISQSSFVFNSNDGFLLKSLHVTCHLLINVWKHDNLVSLAALEVLTTIARVSASSIDSASSLEVHNNNHIEMKSEYMQTTRWICDYICNQCSRPPPAHSRDMHSTIVAAYQCLSVWIYNHSYLLNDTNCVNTLMEVIELGVSGQKSKSTSINPAVGIGTSTIISKGEKQMKPSSMRVREAAESLLNICMVRTSGDDGQRDIAHYDTVLDENDIAEHFGGSSFKSSIRQLQDHEMRQLEAYKLFKYFSDEDSIIFGLFVGSGQDSVTKDSVICLIRTPFGRHCWKMKFNYYSDRAREKIIANKTLGLIKRPFQQCTTPISETRIFTFAKGQNKSLYFNNTAKFFPETIENLQPNQLDQLVCSLDDYMNGQSCARADSRLKRDLDKMSKIFSHQVLAEQKVINECSVRIKRVDCEEPQQLNDLETARILVTHLGLNTALCSLNTAPSSHGGRESVSQSFVNNLRALDSQSVRACDSVNVFYVRRNRTTPIEILESVRERHNVSLEFFEWLLELGQPTVVKRHNRWTGKVYGPRSAEPLRQTTAGGNHETTPITYMDHHHHHPSQLGSGSGVGVGGDDNATILSRNQMLMSDHGGAIFDGDRMILYWTDMCQELAFLVPHRPEKVDSNIMICWLESPDDLANVPCDTLLSQAESGGPQSHSEDSGGGGVGATAATSESGSGGGTLNVGHQSNSSLQSGAKLKDFAKYFICPMKNGLFRINLTTSYGRQWLALPLVDGMTVSKGMLSSLIRESVLNLCRRRRLDADSYQPPHVKRRLKIQEICNNVPKLQQAVVLAR